MNKNINKRVKRDTNINKGKKTKFNNKVILSIVFCLVLIYLIYAVYLLVKEPINKVTVEQRNFIS